jgi:hypothetical protein
MFSGGKPFFKHAVICRRTTASTFSFISGDNLLITFIVSFASFIPLSPFLRTVIFSPSARLIFAVPAPAELTGALLFELVSLTEQHRINAECNALDAFFEPEISAQRIIFD